MTLQDGEIKKKYMTGKGSLFNLKPKFHSGSMSVSFFNSHADFHQCSCPHRQVRKWRATPA